MHIVFLFLCLLGKDKEATNFRLPSADYTSCSREVTNGFSQHQELTMSQTKSSEVGEPRSAPIKMQHFVLSREDAF